MYTRMTQKLELDPAHAGYEAFMSVEPATPPSECVAQNGMVGVIEFYPAQDWMDGSGHFDVEGWEASKAALYLYFRPTRQGYREAMVTLRRQPVMINLIDLADGCGFYEFERRIGRMFPNGRVMNLAPGYRRVQRAGVKFQGFWYRSPWFPLLRGDRVRVRYDPADYDTIEVLAMNKQFICVATRAKVSVPWEDAL